MLAVIPDAEAGFVDTPDCRTALARANTLVGAVAQRDRGSRPAGTAAICNVLRLNRRDMREAADHMQRCMTGHERGENVGQLMASVEDVDAVLARRCR